MVLRLNIHPVYSEEHSDSKYQIGEGRLLRHQVATWAAISDPDVDVVFNTALTWDGKEITRLVRRYDVPARLEAVRRLLDRNALLLTNPDLIHLMMSHQYGWD